MATHDEELLRAAERLLFRRAGLRGKLPNARVRRSISTSYYAVFHFLLEDAARLLVGTRNDLRQRRRVFVRTFTHSGMKVALDKVRGVNVDPSVADFLRAPGVFTGQVTSPPFAREMAAVFSDAQAKRHDADYDLNESFSELDAQLLLDRVRAAIAAWRGAGASTDRDFKTTLCMLMLLKGKVRRDA